MSLVVVLLLAADAPELVQLKQVSAAVDALATRKQATASALAGFPWWVPTFVSPDGPSLAVPFDAVAEFTGETTEHEPDEPVIPYAALDKLATDDPRLRAWALRWLATGTRAAAVSVLEKYVDDPRPAGRFPFVPLGHRPATPIDWRELTVADNALLALQLQIAAPGGFASAAAFRAWRKKNPNLARAFDLQRNGVRLAKSPRDALRALAKADPTLAGLVVADEPSLYAQDLSLASAAFPPARLVKVLAGDEHLAPLDDPDLRCHFERWVFERGALTDAARLGALSKAKPGDLLLASWAGRLDKARQVEILARALAAVPLTGDRSRSLHLWVLDEYVRAGGTDVDRLFFGDPQGPTGVFESIGKGAPQGKALLTRLMADPRFAPLEKALVEDDAGWPLFQSLLRALKATGTKLEGFEGYVYSTQGSSTWYPALTGKKEAAAPFTERRRQFIESLKP